MDRKLHLLDSFAARAADGSTVRVYGYEHLARDDAWPLPLDQWEPTGTVEYRLENGRQVRLGLDGLVRPL